jgi:raffinose/stachyose/melibiose transport system permease protein
MKRLSVGSYVFTRIIVIIGIFIILFPLIWIFSLSIRRSSEVFEGYLYVIPKHITFVNYPEAFEYAKNYFNIGFFQMFLNSAAVTTSTIIVTLGVSIFAGFALSHYSFKGSNLVNTVNLASFMIPSQALLIPMYVFLSRTRIINTYAALVIPYTIFTVPITTLIFKNFFTEIPQELEESARIEGATKFQYLLRIVIPISKPAIATCTIYSFTLIWNEFVLALTFLNKDQLKTFPVAVSTIAGGQYIVPYNILGASMVITIIPALILFLALQRLFIRGITIGALKG